MFSEVGLTDNLDIVSAVLNFSTIKSAFNLFCADKNIRYLLYVKLPDIILNTFSDRYAINKIDYIVDLIKNNKIDYMVCDFIVDLIKNNEKFMAYHCFTICTESAFCIPELLYINTCEYCDSYYNCRCNEYNFYTEIDNELDTKLSINYLTIIIKMRKKCQLLISILNLIFQENSDNCILFPVIYELFSFEEYEWNIFENELTQYVEKYGLYECITIFENFIETKNIFMLEIFAYGQDICKYQDNPIIVSLIKKGTKIVNECRRNERFGCVVNDIYYEYDINTELPPRKHDIFENIKNDEYYAYKEILDRELDEYMNSID